MSLKKFAAIWSIATAYLVGNVWAQGNVWDGSADTDWYEFLRAEFTITTAEQLAGLAELVNGGGIRNNILGGTNIKITLGADIMLNDTTEWKNWETTAPTRTWTPIGNKDNVFSGHFDGAGYVISGVYINSSNDEQGLFGVTDRTIKNLGVAASYVKGNNNIGGLVGQNNPLSRIENCYAAGNVFGSGNSVGGLAGRNLAGTIENCYAVGNVTGGGDVGGLVGYNPRVIINFGGFSDVVSSEIINCYATGVVTATGGSYTFGNNTYKYYSAGGLVGNNEDGTITNCYATGYVTRIGGSYSYNYAYDGVLGGLSGGIITGYSFGIDGHIVGSGTIENSYYNSETSGQNDTRGTPKSTVEMKRQDTYDKWDFTDIWAINQAKNKGYPYLGVIGDEPATPIAKTVTKKTAQSASFAGIKNGQINLNLKAGAYTAQLYNLQGRLVKSVDINAINGINATGLRTDNLSKGIFILNVKQAGVSVLKHKIAVK